MTYLSKCLRAVMQCCQVIICFSFFVHLKIYIVLPICNKKVKKELQNLEFID